VSDSPDDYGRVVYYWLSFANAKSFRGVCIVRSEQTMVHAIRESIVQKCNPGTDYDVQGFPLHEDTEMDAQFVNRLLTREEAEYVALSLKWEVAMPSEDLD
jgi:hypothetical protein